MDLIEHAADILKAGGLVAFPTETVYGLGADARNASAVEKIFKAKGRPSTNPLIVHVADESIARRYTANWPETATRLAKAFWPGPLTLVLPKHDSIAGNVTAGRNTVGLRVPSHPLALQLLARFDGPVAAPSANRSNRISPTTAEHVRQELGHSVNVILDGGPCHVGIESTVLDLTGEVPAILRPGLVHQHQIEEVVGKMEVRLVTVGHDEAAVSPGQQPVHYAPHTPAFRFSEKVAAKPQAAALVIHPASGQWAQQVTLPDEPKGYARAFYAALRKLDTVGLEAIYIEMPPDRPEWAGVRDRIIRATRPL